MHSAPGICPICGEELHVTRLECGRCGTALEGRFALPRLARLSPEHQEFVELFLRAEGKLNRVQEILGISYPTARNRLLAVIRALGYEAEEEGARPPSPAERRAILDDVAAGRMSVDEALQRLRGR